MTDHNGTGKAHVKAMVGNTDEAEAKRRAELVKAESERVSELRKIVEEARRLKKLGREPAWGRVMQTIEIRLRNEMLEEVDEIIEDRMIEDGCDPLDRSDVIRELIAEALAARRKGKSR